MATKNTAIQVISTGETREVLSPSSMAWLIDGYEPQPDGTIKTVAGMSPWDNHAAINSRVYSLYRCNLQGRDFLIGHIAGDIYRHKGWYRSWMSLKTIGISTAPLFREQYAQVGGRIVWCDGTGNLSNLLDIHADELVTELGYHFGPATPSVEGPVIRGAADKSLHLPNAGGYSVPGRIGTIGDELSETSAKLLAGSWTYHAQWESIDGDLSPASPPSSAVSLATQWTDPTAYASAVYTQADIDDLLRGFSVSVSGDNSPENIKAIHLYRSPDSRNDPRGNTPHFLVRIPGSSRVLFPDDMPDSFLGHPIRDIIPVPNARIICAHQGRLICANAPGAEDIVWMSEPNYPGTFVRTSWVQTPDGPVTGIASYNAKLIIFTQTGLYAVTNEGFITPISKSVGCISPTSIQVTSEGLVWLSRDGVFILDIENTITKLTQNLDEIFKSEINPNRLQLSMSAYDHAYRLVLPVAGSDAYTLMLSYTPGRGWMRHNLSNYANVGIINPSCTAITASPDGTLLLGMTWYTIGGGGILTPHYDVKVWDRQMYNETWTSTSNYISSWIMADDTGATSFRVRKMYFRLLDTSNTNINISFERDGVETTVGAGQLLKLTSPIFETQNYEHLGDVVLGQDVARRSAPYWRYVAAPVELGSVRSFRFKISGLRGQEINLAGIAFDMEIISGDQYGRIPGGLE